ncbi:MAG: hypothetical protein GEV11_15015 [Streptosporangiales bacterium]|nr:hypothetical protein [Streptosporangiales bacterium]
MTAPGAEALRAVEAEWRPEPVAQTETIIARPSIALAGVFDQPSPVAGDGDPLPPLWHWLHFLELPATSELGEDGHPKSGPFLPEYPRRRRMFGGARLRVRAPLRVGQTVTRDSRVASVTFKEGRSGAMLFVTVEHRFSADGAELCVEEQDIVYRQDPEPGSGPAVAPAAARAGAPAPAAPGQEGPKPDWRWSLDPTEVLLFQFSALTYNAHRIHHDYPYVTQVEGFPGLVVHGPLSALGLLELPRQAGVEIASFEFRARKPLYAGTPVEFTGVRPGGGAGDRAELTAFNAHTPGAVTGSVELA